MSDQWNTGADPAFLRDQAQTGDAAASDLSLGDIFLAIWRRKRWIIWPLLIVTGLAYLYLATTPNRYTSEARLLVEDRQSVFTRADGETAGRVLVDQEAIASQVQVILGRDLARSVIDQLDLTAHPEFNSTSGAAPSLSKRILIMLGLSRDPSRLSQQEQALETYYDRLSVYRVEGSRVIAISFTARSPELAARISNSIADRYIDLQRNANRQSTTQATEWLGTQIAELRSKVEAAEERVVAYRNSQGLQRGSSDAPLSNQQLSELNSQLILAKTSRAEAEARAQTIRDRLKAGDDIANMADVVNSPYIQRLLEQQITLRRRIAELSPTLLPSHPRMRELSTELRDLRTQIADEARKVVAALEGEARVAGAREKAIQTSLDSLKQQAVKAGEAEVELHALEREAKAQRELLESFLVRYRQADALKDAQVAPAEARIISRATVSNTPSYPKRGQMLAIIVIATLLATSALAVGAELFRHARGIGTRAPTPPRQVYVPAIGPREDKTPAIADPIPATAPLAGPAGVGRLETAHFPPSVRDVASELVKIRDKKKGCLRVLLSTPQRQELGNHLAVNVARCLAAGDARVVLIDANLRAPRVALQLGFPEAPGLSELLSGNCAFADAIRRDPRSRMHVISAGANAQNAARLFGSDRFGKALEALSGSYQYVLIDAPPVSLSPEIRDLARHIDVAVMLADTLPGSARLMDKAVETLQGNAAEPIQLVQATLEASHKVALPGQTTDRRVA